MAAIAVDKEKKRVQIALGALNVFMDKGFSAASVSDVANALEIGKGTIYEYFKSKDELVVASMVTWAEINSGDPKHFETDLGIDDPAERLKTFVFMAMQIYMSEDKNMKVMLAMVQLYMEKPEFFKEHHILQDILAGMRHFICECLKDGVTKGLFRPEIEDQSEDIAINLMAYLDGIAIHHFMDPDYIKLQEQVDFHIEMLLGCFKA